MWIGESARLELAADEGSSRYLSQVSKSITPWAGRNRSQGVPPTLSRGPPQSRGFRLPHRRWRLGRPDATADATAPLGHQATHGRVRQMRVPKSGAALKAPSATASSSTGPKISFNRCQRVWTHPPPDSGLRAMQLTNSQTASDAAPKLSAFRRASTAPSPSSHASIWSAQESSRPRISLPVDILDWSPIPHRKRLPTSRRTNRPPCR